MNLMPFDQLSNIENKIRYNKTIKNDKEIIENEKEIEDEILDLLILSYLNGISDVNESVGTFVQPDEDEMYKQIYKKYNGLNFEEDLKRYATDGKDSGMILVADTNMHRMYTIGQHSAALRGGVARYKTWETMMDEKVRDQHFYLQGITIPVDAEFYTYTGAKAKMPGSFNDPANDCNCRCILSFHR